MEWGAKSVALGLMRQAIKDAAKPGVVMATPQYKTRHGVLTCEASLSAELLEMFVRWNWQAHGKPSEYVLPARAVEIIAEHMESI